MAYYYRRKRNVKRKTKRAAKTKKAGKKLATRAYVKRILHKEAENKFYTSFASSQTVYVQVNSAPSTGAGLIKLIPPVALGNNSSNRIGNKIRVVKSTLNMMLNLKPFNATTNAYTPGVWVKIWIFKLKTSNIASGPTLGEFQSFFQGNGANIPFQGSQLDLTFKVNTDLFEICKTKTIFLTSSSNSANGIPNATSWMFGSGQNSKRVSFNLTKMLGTLQYNDATTDSCTNRNLWCVVQPIYSQFNAVSGNFNDPIQITYSQATYYEDM